MEIEDQERHLGVALRTRDADARYQIGLDQSPVWTPDGRRLVFTSQAGGVLGSLFWQAADGTGVAEPSIRAERSSGARQRCWRTARASCSRPAPA